MPSKFSQTRWLLVAARHANHGPVPVRRVAQALGNDLGAVVFAVERLRIDAIVHQRSEHRARHRGRVPAARVEFCACHLRARLRRLGNVLESPAAFERDGLRCAGGLCGQRGRQHAQKWCQSKKAKAGTAMVEMQRNTPSVSESSQHCAGNAHFSFSDRTPFCSARIRRA